MRIDSSGSLLLGTTTNPTYGGFPRSTLSIKQLNDSSTGYNAIQIEASADQSVLGIGYNGDVFAFNTSYRATGAYKGISFGTTNTEHVRIGTDGILHKLGTSSSSRILPYTDNVGYIGESTKRWQAIYAVNGTIQTSDGREKNTIEDSNLGLSFVNSLRPVSYKWNVGENVVTYDEDSKEVATPRAGVRVHYGFIAQEVKAAIPEGVDFGGFVQEPNEGMMSLRYHEFIGPLVKAIQEQQALITQLQADVAALKGA
jgi:hypothetical protein